MPYENLKSLEPDAPVDDIEAQSKRRSDILLVWHKLWATGTDTGWLEVIRSAHQAGQMEHHRSLDLDFPTPEGETILYKAVGYRHAKSRRNGFSFWGGWRHGLDCRPNC